MRYQKAGGRAVGRTARGLVLVLLTALACADHYATLGISRTADASAVKRAYKKQALQCHPDKVVGDTGAAAKRFQRLQEAYEVLGDERQRRIYDAQQAGGGFQRGGVRQGSHRGQGFAAHRSFSRAPPPHWHAPSFDFDFSGFAPPSPPPLRPAVREYHCSLQELAFGCRRRIVLRDHLISRLADSWADVAGAALARSAMTMGGLVVFVFRFVGSVGYALPVCPWWVPTFLAVATYACGVYQLLPQSPRGTFEVHVKPGWRNGEQTAHRPKRGDREIVFVLRERAHPTLTRDDDDLVYRTSLSRRTARRGFTMKVPQLRGPPLVVSIAPGEAVDGRERVLSGAGMPVKGGTQRGNLKIRFSIR
uniref:J domain-containing protein n=1 Tax=Calcidiscus leptoporus TaxID=127549 RepID=A0A7S0JGC7_9EUKA